MIRKILSKFEANVLEREIKRKWDTVKSTELAHITTMAYELAINDIKSEFLKCVPCRNDMNTLKDLDFIKGWNAAISKTTKNIKELFR